METALPVVARCRHSPRELKSGCELAWGAWEARVEMRKPRLLTSQGLLLLFVQQTQFRGS